MKEDDLENDIDLDKEMEAVNRRQSLREDSEEDGTTHGD